MSSESLAQRLITIEPGTYIEFVSLENSPTPFQFLPQGTYIKIDSPDGLVLVKPFYFNHLNQLFPETEILERLNFMVQGVGEVSVEYSKTYLQFEEITDKLYENNKKNTLIGIGGVLIGLAAGFVIFGV